jgi:hypothetical protein
MTQTDTKPAKAFLSKLKGFVSNNNQWQGFVEARVAALWENGSVRVWSLGAVTGDG